MQYARRMRFVFSSEGTWGDVLSPLFVARALQARGHKVLVLSNERYAAFAASIGVPYRTTSTTADYDAFVGHPDAWRPLRSLGLLGTAIGMLFERTLPVAMEKVPAADLVVGWPLSFATKTAAEASGKPYATLLPAPLHARTLERLPVFGSGIDLNRLPEAIRAQTFTFADPMLDRVFPRSINEARGTLGLPPIRAYMGWQAQSELAVGLWPEWYARVEADQPNLRLAGFPIVGFTHDRDPELEAWLAEGPAPIVATLGSGYPGSAPLFEALRALAEEDGERVVLLRPGSAGMTRPSGRVFETSGTDLASLLPRASAFVHHGGAGTIAQAVRAGVPQLVMPLAHDQPDNAARVAEHGLGRVLKDKRPSVARLRAALGTVRTAAVRERCAAVSAEERAAPDAVERAANLLEVFAQTGRA